MRRIHTTGRHNCRRQFKTIFKKFFSGNIMSFIERRKLMFGAAAAVVASASALAGSRRVPIPQNARERMRELRFPNVPLVTHTGQNVRFYDDILKDRKVVINFMYTVCSGICTPVTQNLLEARRLLGTDAKDIRFYSISLTPADDSPAALREYMEMQQIDEGWTFLTGEPRHVERVRQGLGFVDTTPEADADITNHSGMVRIGNEPMVSWGHASGLTTGKAIARMIRFELT